MNGRQTAEWLFRQDSVQDFLGGRWTLEEYLFGTESLWFCQMTHFIFSYSRKGHLEGSGGCLIVILITDPAIHIAYLLDFDVVEKMEIAQDGNSEYARTQLLGEEKGTSATKRLIIGEYSRSMAVDVRSAKHVDLTKAASHFDHMRLWNLVQQFSRERIQDSSMKQTFSSVLRKAIQSVRAA